MQTKQKFSVLGMLVLGVMVAGFNAKPANAQEFCGKFTLTSTTRWNQATLPPGDYSFTLDHTYPGSKFMVQQGTRSVAQIPTRGFSYITSGSAEMVLENGSVRKLSLPQIGIAFEYPGHNPGHRAAPQEPSLAQVIKVATTGAGR